MAKSGSGILKWLSLIFPVGLFLIMVSVAPPWGMSYEAWSVLAATIWIASWWITEAVPIPVTSILPIILFPMFADVPLAMVTSAYGHPTIFLFLGGFLIALAIERCHLHKRIALYIIFKIGTDKKRVILGFMVATFLISMWISNTAAVLMMLPIALAVSAQLGDAADSGQKHSFGLPLLLGIAYSASIGGMGTLIGTPTNAMFSAISNQYLEQEVTFSAWMGLAFPVSFILLFVAWFMLTRVLFKVEKSDDTSGDVIERQLEQLGKMKADEWKVILIFTATAFAWISRSFILEHLMPSIDDTIISMAGAALMFIIPSSSQKGGLLDWESTRKLPWGVLLLFGGGLALTEGFKHSGLVDFLGDLFIGLETVEAFTFIPIIVGSVNFLTEVTSNVATVSIMLPVLISLSEVIGLHPHILMVGATLSASCAFMLPVATPPNAVVFGTGFVQIRDMVRAGFLLNLISIVIIVFFVWLVLPLMWSL
ncbi:MAG: DASS family sodium-coupled anion symporter [Cyclobacteriaceae bacterium]|nr:DASS family sodium-coupled anion symporter [Cyclobacteriaceae bacterium]